MSNKKGEIATIVTLSSLVVLGVISLLSSYFFKKKIRIRSQATTYCSRVDLVTFTPSQVQPGQTFTCNISGLITNQYTMACGWSKNGGWPQGQISGSCSGNNCRFQVKMEDQVDPNAIYELVGFDYRGECGPNTGKRVSLDVAGVSPKPSQPGCQGDCCGKPDGYIIQSHVRMECDSNYQGGRYVIIDRVCRGGQVVDQPNCASCRSCRAGDSAIAPVPAQDLAVNECTGGCGVEQGICSGLSTCADNITPAIIRNCTDSTFSCPSGYSSCKKEGAIWCYRSSGGGQSGGQPPTQPPLQSSPTTPPTATLTPRQAEDPYCYYLNFQECKNIGMCLGQCVRCENGKYKCTSEITPSLTPKGSGKPPQGTPTPTSTSTPTPTPLTHLPNTQEIINLKGIVSFEIPFVNNKYYNDYVSFYSYKFFNSLSNSFSDFDFSLKRETNCNLFDKIFNRCTYSAAFTLNPAGVIIYYFDLDRYYSQDGISLTPNTFYFRANYLGNLYEKRFNFQNYYQDRLTFNDLPSIDLAKYYRKISLRFAKNSQYLYQEGEKSIKLYIEPLPNNFNSIEKVNFDNEIDIIYISYYNSPPLPSKITIVPTYACGNISESKTLTPNITIPESGTFDSTENDAGVIQLNCS